VKPSSIWWGRFACACLATALMGVSPLACSQAARGKVDPGRLQKELNKPPAPKADQARPAPMPVPARKASGLEAAGAFQVDAIRLEGNTVWTQSELQPELAEAMGAAVHLADLNAVAERVQTRYRNAGYLLAQVIVPRQEVQNGQVVLQVFEGEIGEVVYQGTGTIDAIRRYGDKLRAQRPLTVQALERYLLLMNDVPGIQAFGTLSPSGSKVGSATLTISATLKSLSGDVSVNNRLTKSIGPWRAEAGIELANLFESQERFSARLIEGLKGRVSIGSVGWDQNWGVEGFRTAVSVSAVRSRPESDLPEVSGSTSLGLSASYPWLRSRSRNAYVRLSVNALNSHADTAGQLAGVALFQDRVRALRAGLTFDLADSLGGVSLLDIEYSKGLGGLGASQPNAVVPVSRKGADNHFGKVTIFASRLQAVTQRLSLLLAVNAQSTGQTLYASEQFGAGGDLFLRAFDPSELTGDRGYAAKAELRWALVDALSTYAFYDLARVSNADAGNVIVGGDKAAALGVGVRYQQGPVAGFVECAKPLQRDVAAQGERKARAFAGIKYGF
jgi:hemolysin activation/secretion protein